MKQSKENIPTYPQDVLKLLDKAGFIAAYFDELKNWDRHEDAYNHIEEVHEHFFNKRKYSDYMSFKVQLSNFKR